MKFAFFIMVAMGLLLLFILLRPVGVMVDTVFSSNCKSLPSDQLLPSIILTDDDQPAAPAFLPPETVATRLDAAVEAVQNEPSTIVIWVHGFRTDSTAATCIAGRLKESFDTRASGALAPQFITFAWPSSFARHDFSKAQSHAERAAEHLASLLDRVHTERVTLIAHSLGGQVALEALLKSDKVKTAPIAHLVLVQAAVSHASIRSWQGERRVTLPAAGTDPPGDPIVEPIGPGSGCYVRALSRTRKVTITSIRRDNVLSGAFATSTNMRQPCFGPAILGNRANMNLMPGSLALGLPFSDPTPSCIATHAPGPSEIDTTAPLLVPADGSGWHEDDLVLPLPEAAGFTSGAGSVCTSVDFSLPRDDIDFFDLDSHRWLLVGHRHNPLSHPRLRNAIVARIVGASSR